jgi:hypothetical protein
MISASALATPAKKKNKAAPAATAEKKITSKEVIAWKKSGMSDDEIVSRANEGGFRMTALAKSRLQKAHTPKSLMAALEGKPVEAKPVEAKKADESKAEISITASRPKNAGPKPININHMIDPNEIDFDSVPPPAGIPQKYVSSNQPKKPQIDRSMRPSAPFDEKSATADAKKPERAPAGASKTERASSPPVASNNAGNTGKRRVVFTAQGDGGE